MVGEGERGSAEDCRQSERSPVSADAAMFLRRFILALAVWREARGESKAGQRLVAQAIENRVHDPRWPDTYVGVITQHLQFSAFNMNDPNVVKYPSETDQAWPNCVEAADVVLNSIEPLTDANHYHSTGVWPTWARKDREVAREGRHMFYAL